jgi:maltose O-acetyltransferase
MRTEKEKMLAGELYDPLDSELVQARDRARDLCQDLNATRERDQDARRAILKQLFGQGGESVWMQPPFFCDYGSNILLGERVFFNFNCVVLDVCVVKIGDFTLFGPGHRRAKRTHLRRRDRRAKRTHPSRICSTGDFSR